VYAWHRRALIVISPPTLSSGGYAFYDTIHSLHKIALQVVGALHLVLFHPVIIAGVSFQAMPLFSSAPMCIYPAGNMVVISAPNLSRKPTLLMVGST